MAIVTMVAANMAAGSLLEPHPFWFRLYGSFAAPAFILVAGMMVARGAEEKGHGLRRYLVRGALVLLVGALIDALLWATVPGTTFDVLYLIGVAIPLTYLSLRLPSAGRLALALAVFALAIPLRMRIGYAEYPTEIPLVPGVEPTVATTPIWAHWLVDGWFPLFPWLGFALLGAALHPWWAAATARERVAWALPAGALVAAVGALVWWRFPSAMLTREGYSELFYPPSTGYVLTATGVVLLAAALAARWTPAPLARIGEAPLLLYVAHLVLLRPFAVLGPQPMGVFLLEHLAVLGGVVGIAYAARAWKDRHPSRSVVASLLLGG